MTLMLSKEKICEEAKLLDDAERSRKQIVPLSARHAMVTIEDAYHIQDEWIRLKMAKGHKVIGHKVGLTSKVMQKAMNIDEPDFGILMDNMYFDSGSEINAADYLDPRVEVEVAFILAKDLTSAKLSTTHILDATQSIHGAIELIAARSYRTNPDTGYTRTVKDTISDNAANAGIIMSKKEISKMSDLPWISAVLRKNGVIEESGVAAAVLDNPINGVKWLAEKYHSIGRILKAGDIILSGSFTRPIAVKKGDEIVADFNQFGRVECKFI